MLHALKKVRSSQILKRRHVRKSITCGESGRKKPAMSQIFAKADQ